MFTIPNPLSFARFPLAAAFLATVAVPARVALIGATSLTDVLDGWLARRQQTTHLGALLDQIADKTFVLVAISAIIDYTLLLSRERART